jgi:hypothetical protein
MNKLKIICFAIAILFGIFVFVYGGYDDSPGAQLIGLLIIIITVFCIIKNKKR